MPNVCSQQDSLPGAARRVSSPTLAGALALFIKIIDQVFDRAFSSPGLEDFQGRGHALRRVPCQVEQEALPEPEELEGQAARLRLADAQAKFVPVVSVLRVFRLVAAALELRFDAVPACSAVARVALWASAFAFEASRALPAVRVFFPVWHVAWTGQTVPWLGPDMLAASFPALCAARYCAVQERVAREHAAPVVARAKEQSVPEQFVQARSAPADKSHSAGLLVSALDSVELACG